MLFFVSTTVRGGCSDNNISIQQCQFPRAERCNLLILISVTVIAEPTTPSNPGKSFDVSVLVLLSSLKEHIIIIISSLQSSFPKQEFTHIQVDGLVTVLPKDPGTIKANVCENYKQFITNVSLSLIIQFTLGNSI